MTPERPPVGFYDEDIERLYDELDELQAKRTGAHSSDPDLEIKLGQTFARLRELQEKEIASLRIVLDQSLEMPFGEGQRILADARRLLSENEDTAP